MINAAKQFTHSLWRRLRHASTAVSLLVLLSLGVMEPLLCVIHCEIMALRADAQHAHVSSTNYVCAFTQQTVTKHQTLAHHALIVSTASPSPLHAMSINERGVPTTSNAQPQPFHEMAFIASALLLIILLVLRDCNVTPLAPPQRFFRPPLRPPTASLPWNMA